MRKFITMLSLGILASFFYYNHVQAQGLKIGDSALGFDLKNIDEQMVSLDDYQQDESVKGVIVIFTCNHCPYSKLYEDRIVAIDKKFKSEGYPVVAINPNDPKAYPSDDFENMKKRAAEKSFTFPYLVDETQEIARGYGATRTPHVYLLAKGAAGFSVAYIGAIDDNSRNANKVEEEYLADAIMALEAGKKPAPATTKAIGCSIKWK